MPPFVATARISNKEKEGKEESKSVSVVSGLKKRVKSGSAEDTVRKGARESREKNCSRREDVFFADHFFPRGCAAPVAPSPSLRVYVLASR